MKHISAMKTTILSNILGTRELLAMFVKKLTFWAYAFLIAYEWRRYLLKRDPPKTITHMRDFLNEVVTFPSRYQRITVFVLSSQRIRERSVPKNVINLNVCLI